MRQDREPFNYGYDKRLEVVLANPATSVRLKAALVAFDKADPCDALREAKACVELCQARLNELQDGLYATIEREKGGR